ncbi:MAG: hypothetical protein ACYC8T_07550 [Myxococcaceae bacterium]
MKALAAIVAVALAQGSAGTEVQDAPVKAAVWVHPMAWVFDVAVSASFVGSKVWQVPLGVTIAGSESWSVAAEATFTSGTTNPACGAQCQFWGVALAIGPAFSIGGRGQLSGLFIEPKLIIGHSEPRGWTLFPRPPRDGVPLSFTQTDTTDFQLGLDVGYQLRWKHLYFAPLLGASGGMCFGCSSDIAGPLGPRATPGARWVYGLNLNLMRLGAVF